MNACITHSTFYLLRKSKDFSFGVIKFFYITELADIFKITGLCIIFRFLTWFKYFSECCPWRYRNHLSQTVCI